MRAVPDLCQHRRRNLKQWTNKLVLKPLKPGNQGFSLIEVVISIGILMSLTIAVAGMLRSGFDVKAGLSMRAKTIHRLTVTMQKLSDDVQQTFFVPTTDDFRNGVARRTKSLFKIDKVLGNKLSLTTKTHHTIIAGKYESDLTLVVYELRDSKAHQGRKALYRGETTFIPEDLKESPPMRMLADDLKDVVYEFWNGEDWKNDRWDTGASDTRNRLPRLLRITIEAYARDWEEGDQGADDQQATEKLQTVVLLTEAANYPELKTQTSTIRWENL